MKFSNLHQHTTFSDGKSSMEEVVLSAIEKEMESIGFSDHSYTEIDKSYCLLFNRYSDYHKQIDLLKEKYKDKIKIFKGLEIDYYSNENSADYDYTIASVHYLCDGEKCYPIDISLEGQLRYINDCCGGDKNKFAKNYFDLLIKNVKKISPNIIGHFDLITKFGLFDKDNLEYREIALNAVKEIIKYCNVFEVNTGAIARKRRAYPYPERYLLEEILKLNGEVVLSSDSHMATTVDFYFNESIELLKDVGFKYFLKFDGEKFYKEYI